VQAFVNSSKYRDRSPAICMQRAVSERLTAC
jgi:hypothetical protein